MVNGRLLRNLISAALLVTAFLLSGLVAKPAFAETPPTVSATFDPAAAAAGSSTAKLTLSFVNTNASASITGVGMSAAPIPSGITLTQSNASCTGASSAITASDLAVSGISMDQGSSCSIEYTVTIDAGAAQGTTYTFTPGAPTSAESGPGVAGAGDQLTVLAAPAYSSQSVTVPFGTATLLPLTNTGGTAASFTVETDPAHGTAAASASGITYTPGAGYNGPDSLTFTATNAAGTSTEATVTITVSAPVLNVSLNGSGAAAGIALSGYSVGATGGTSPYACALSSGSSLPSGLSLSTSCELTGTPAAEGIANFSVDVTDSSTPTATKSQTLSLGVGPGVPAFSDSSANIAYGASASTLQLTSTGGAATSFTITKQPSNVGTATASGASISFTPGAGLHGTDTLKFTATNAAGTSAETTVTITVSAPAVNVSLTGSGAQAGLPLSGYAISPSGGASPYTCAIHSGSALPSGISLSGCSLSGTPVSAGTFTFDADVTDSSTPAFTATQTLTLSVATGLQVPAFADSTATVNYNASAAALPLTNTGGGADSYTVTANPAHGTATTSATGISYKPNTGFRGTDSLKFNALNAAGTSAEATVTITVSDPSLTISLTGSGATAGTALSGYAVNTAGGASPYTCALASGSSLPAGVSLAADCSLSGTPAAAGDTAFSVDVTDSSTTTPFTQTQPLTLSVAPGLAVPAFADSTATVGYNATGSALSLTNTGGAAASFTVTQSPANGTATASASGITYQPNTGFHGSDTLKFTATNAAGTSAEATVSITVSAPTLTVSLNGSGARATVALSGYAVSTAGGASPYTCALTSGSSLPAGVSLAADCALTGTPSAAGDSAFSVDVTDSSSPAVTKTQTLTLSVAAAPASPAYADSTASVGYNAANAALTLGANSGDAATGFTITQAPANGTATASASGISYQPNTGFHGSDTLKYTASNAAGTSAEATISITVASPAPLAVSLTGSGAAAGSTLSGYAIGVTGGSGSYSCAVNAGSSLPAGVSLSGCSLTGTPSASGTFSFDVDVEDTSTPKLTKTQTLSLNVSASLAAPAFADSTASFAYNGTTAALPLTNTGGAAASFTVTQNPTQGIAVASASGITYTPGLDAHGTDTVKFTATNAGGTSAEATVTITVGAPTLSVSLSGSGAMAGSALSGYSVAASGGAGPYSCVLASGSLPSGVSLTSACALTGTPSASGTFSFSADVTDKSKPPVTKTQALSLVVGAPAAPAIWGISPNSGSGAGGDTVEITGQNLSGATLTVGGSAVAITSNDGSSLQFTTPAHAAGTVNVVVTTAGGSATTTFDYTAPAQVLSLSANPASFDNSQTVAITLAGKQSTGATTFTVSSTPANLCTIAKTSETAATLSGAGTGTGTCVVTASVAADSNYAAMSATANVSLAKTNQTITFNTLADKNYGDAPVTLTATASSGLPVSFTSSTTAVCTVAAGKATLIKGGTCTIVAEQTGNGIYNAAPAVTRSFTVTQTGMAVTLSSDKTSLIYGKTAKLTVTGAAAGSTVTYQLTAGAGLCKVTPGSPATTATLKALAGTGSCTVKAVASASGAVAGGESAPITISLTKLSAKLAVSASPSRLYVGSTAKLSASGGGTGAVTYALDPSSDGICSLAGNVATGIAAGDCLVLVSKAADANNLASSASITLLVDRRADPLSDPIVTEIVEAQLRDGQMLIGQQVSNMESRFRTLHAGARSDVNFGLSLAETGNNSLPAEVSQAMQERARAAKADALLLQDSDAGMNGTAKGDFAGSKLAANGDSPTAPIYSMWSAGTVTYGRQNIDGSDERAKFTTTGITIGADTTLADGMISGVAFGYGEAKADIGEDSSNDSRTFSAMAYSSWQAAPSTWIDVALGYGNQKSDVSRWSSQGNTLLTGDRTAHQLFATLTASYEYELEEGLILSPYARLEAAYMRYNAYTEDGAKDWAMHYERMNVKSLALVPGMRAEWTILDGSGGVFKPMLGLSYARSFTGAYEQVTTWADDINGPGFAIKGKGKADGLLEMQAGFGLSLPEGYDIGLEYRYAQSLDGTSLEGTNQTVNARFEMQF